MLNTYPAAIEKMHLHAAIFGSPVETELVNEPTSAENFSRFLNARPRFELSIPVMQDESLNM